MEGRLAIDRRRAEVARAEARTYRGVAYIPRKNKFLARISVNGIRRDLGYTLTAESASYLYEAALAVAAPERKASRAARGVSQRAVTKSYRRAGSFVALYTEWLALSEKGRFREPVAGSILVYDDQRYTSGGVAWRYMRGSRWKLLTLTSLCRTCKAPFAQMIPLSAKACGGVLRTCADHRAKRSAASLAALDAAKERRDAERAIRGPKTGVGDAVQYAVVDRVLGDMSLLQDRIRLDEVVVRCARHAAFGGVDAAAIVARRCAYRHRIESGEVIL